MVRCQRRGNCHWFGKCIDILGMDNVVEVGQYYVPILN